MPASSSSVSLVSECVGSLLAEGDRADVSPLVELLRREDVDILHLQLAVGQLKDKVAEGSDPQTVLAAWRRLDQLFADCLERTSLVHERVLEMSARGFVETDAAGTVVYANRAFRELVPGWRGASLLSLFPEHERDFIGDALAGGKSARLLRRMELDTGSRVIPMSVEIGSIGHGRSRTGGYAVLGNIEAFLRAEQKLFEASEVGIVRVDRQLRQIRFANPSAAALLGREIDELVGSDPRTLLTPASRGLLELAIAQLERDERCDEIEVDYVRPDGMVVPVQLTLYPEFNELGVRVGLLTELRSLIERKAARAISDAASSQRSHAALFSALLEEIRGVIPIDGAALFAYSDDMQYARAIIRCPAPPNETLCWWPVNDQWRAWLASDAPLIANFKKDMEQADSSQKDMDRSETAWYLKQDLVAWAAVPLRSDHGVRIALLLTSKQVNFFKPQHFELLRRIGVHRALEALNGLLDRRRSEFLLDLSKALQPSENAREAAQVLVSRLAKFYGWPNVSIFKVNQVRKQFELIAQARGPKGYFLPSNYVMQLSEGVLGKALDTGQPQILNNAEDPDEPLAKLYKPSTKQTKSELAYPIRFLGRVVWVLNLEDRQENGFTREVERELASIVGDPEEKRGNGELQRILERLFERIILGHILDAATQGIVVMRSPGGIRLVNRKAEKLLLGATSVRSKRGSRLVSRNLASFAADASAAEVIQDRRSVNNSPISLLGADGVTRKVLATSTRLEEEYDHQVFFLQDLSELKWETDSQIMREAMGSLAAHTRTPLANAGRLLRELTEVQSSENIRTLVERALAQLGKVSVTYHRIQESFSTELQRQVAEVRLDRLVEDQVRQISPLERDQVVITEASVTPVAGDPDRLKFVVASILEYLLRRSGGDGRIDVAARPGPTTAILTIDGPHAHDPTPTGVLDSAIESTRDVLEIGTAAIRRIVEEEHGGLFRSDTADGRIAFRVELPLAAAGGSTAR